jgi:gamma-glutamyl-gamma-aminobutyrate hydrolase PuuD
MKPIIGITAIPHPDPSDLRSGGKLQLNWNYADEIAKAGGVPVLLPPMADASEVANILDGWLIPGGDDIDASNYGQTNHPKAELVDKGRFDAESRLWNAVDPAMPILGICYGCQFINVLSGGSIIQHLPDVLGHEEHTAGTLQHYGIDVSSRLSEILCAEGVEGRSYHHQAIDRVGEGLKVVGRHADGTIEALETSDSRWLFAVQWHPERTPEDGPTQRLFAQFVAAAFEFRQSRRGVGVAR